MSALTNTSSGDGGGYFIDSDPPRWLAEALGGRVLEARDAWQTSRVACRTALQAKTAAVRAVRAHAAEVERLSRAGEPLPKPAVAEALDLEHRAATVAHDRAVAVSRDAVRAYESEFFGAVRTNIVVDLASVAATAAHSRVLAAHADLTAALEDRESAFRYLREQPAEPTHSIEAAGRGWSDGAHWSYRPGMTAPSALFELLRTLKVIATVFPTPTPAEARS